MGLRESKPTLAYDDASRRISLDDYERIKTTFKRYAGHKETISQLTFIRDILAEVPPSFSEELYLAFGGHPTKGISFRDLFCGLVLLSNGSIEEKIKFIFAIISVNHGPISVEDITRLWNISVTSPLPDSFKVDFNHPMNITTFTTWIKDNKSISEFAIWLLTDKPIRISDDMNVPTFHETLADYCKLSKKDIWDFERRFYILKSKSENSKFDLKYFKQITSPPLPAKISTELFNWLDQNQDGYLDIVEMAKGVAYLCRFENNKRVETMFHLFDEDKDGILNRGELKDALELLYEIQLQNQLESIPAQADIDLDQILTEILESYKDQDSDEPKNFLTQTEFINWGSRDGCVLEELLKVIFQICHVIFGLRPQSRIDERDVIKGYMIREMREKILEGNVKYIISKYWYTNWQKFVEYDPKTTKVPYSNKHSKHSHKHRAKRSKQTDKSYNLEDYEPYEVPADNDQRKLRGPGPIDNKGLCQFDARNKACSVITGEGGILRPGLDEDYHFVTLPEPVWKALAAWYDGTYPLPRLAYRNLDTGRIELELYPINLSFYKHTSFPSKHNVSKQGETGGITVQSIMQYVMNLAGSTGAVGQPQNLNPPGVLNPIYRQHSYYAAFSRYATIKLIQEFIVGIFKLKQDEVRLWDLSDEETPVLLEEEDKNLEELNYRDKHKILIEIRNKDNSWPEEVIQVMKKVQRQESEKGNVPQAVGSGKVLKGCTGLNNLGNTCYMNSAFQCLSNTHIFTQYFLVGRHLKELNKTNPLGTKGVLARRYGELVHDLWSGNNRAVAPLKFKWTLGRYEPQFNNFNQQDAQELLSVLLDRLHEDLNLVITKPYKELPDSDGRPDCEVSQEHWDYHLKRNRYVHSIYTGW
ncbi:Ubiquitin carboxyl-terminal hydrolase 32-like [Oopsacas minuta]|uniref:ubiquitinyl hydrolase 1 n=1 Tax=Oopsacas minuta TaxID=111878 RepID=A0AAV7JDP5_9METZ|nr:Ubiquitin carboxyl-terminal hydrolase 32-like [Oopsacas minuta]